MEGGRALSRANPAGADQRNFNIEGAHSRSPNPKAFWEPQGKARGHLSLEASMRPNLGTALFVVLSRRKWGCSPSLVSDPAFGLQSVSQRLVTTRAERIQRQTPTLGMRSSTTYFLTASRCDTDGGTVR